MYSLVIAMPLKHWYRSKQVIGKLNINNFLLIQETHTFTPVWKKRNNNRAWWNIPEPDSIVPHWISNICTMNKKVFKTQNVPIMNPSCFFSDLHWWYNLLSLLMIWIHCDLEMASLALQGEHPGLWDEIPQPRTTWRTREIFQPLQKTLSLKCKFKVSFMYMQAKRGKDGTYSCVH